MLAVPFDKLAAVLIKSISALGGRRLVWILVRLFRRPVLGGGRGSSSSVVCAVAQPGIYAGGCSCFPLLPSPPFPSP